MQEIIQYCRKNPMAIQFSSQEEYKQVTALFGDKTPEFVIWPAGYITYTVVVMPYDPLPVTMSFSCGRRLCGIQADYPVISAREFLALCDENKSILTHAI